MRRGEKAKEETLSFQKTKPGGTTTTIKYECGHTDVIGGSMADPAGVMNRGQELIFSTEQCTICTARERVRATMQMLLDNPALLLKVYEQGYVMNFREVELLLQGDQGNGQRLLSLVIIAACAFSIGLAVAFAVCQATGR
jgi:hypothetical protein